MTLVYCRNTFCNNVEVVELICKHAFAADEPIERVTILCDAMNDRSAAVARRAGFQLEARLRSDRRNHHGELMDTLVFSRLRNSVAFEEEAVEKSETTTIANEAITNETLENNIVQNEGN